MSNLLKSIDVVYKKRKKDVLDDLKRDAIEYAKQETPIHMGDLRESIRTEDGNDEFELIWGDDKVDYAQVVAFGSKPHVILPKKTGGVLVFEKNGTKIFTKKVNHPGTKANPYHIRTLNTVKKLIK